MELQTLTVYTARKSDSELCASKYGVRLRAVLASTEFSCIFLNITESFILEILAQQFQPVN